MEWWHGQEGVPERRHEQGQGVVPEWSRRQESEASYEELSCHDPSNLRLSLHTKPPHALNYLIGEAS
jgi:hypothetical protein